MAPCSIAFGAAFAAVQLVYQAYSKVKTNRARCARLVDRCQYIVDRIQRLVAAHGDEAVRVRIGELEATFASVARIITEVGTQGVLASLLHSDANALQIEACTDALADLLTLFNLENTADIGRWQREFEDARLRDHEELRGLGRRLESGNAAIARELAQQGVTIAEVHRLVQNISVGLPASDATSDDPTQTQTQTQIQTPASPTSPTIIRDAPCTCEKPAPPTRRSSTVRRSSWTSRVKLPPLANVLTKLSSPSRRPLSRPGPGIESPVGDADTAQALDPPPPYRLHVANLETEPDAGGSGAHSEDALSLQGSGFTISNASSEAIRAPDSPVPTLSPCSPPQSTFDDCFVKRSTTRRKRTTSVSATSTPTLRRKDAVIFRRKTIAAGAWTYQPVFYDC
ncbi:hypothetical protein EVG20_g5936 [Dentipellis fragilis]|uniref:Uncharacterized protein n=1 Tax=Dentipellis fragilis TaxID=205917 RepID=A0A4Y9YPG9_9AGAM|nr:hypothetical protein EVG20_g5936 [Dentipellis fragilis]